MRSLGYLTEETKAINIDFSVITASADYALTNANLLIEFANAGGLAMPTRLDVIPYKFSPYSQQDPSMLSVEGWRLFFLIIFTVTTIARNVKKVMR